MSHPRLSAEEIGKRGKELYKSTLRDKVETQENIGKQIVIDIETGEYDIDEDGLAASLRMLAKHPGAALWGERIGYNAVYAVGGSLTRTTPQ